MSHEIIVSIQGYQLPPFILYLLVFYLFTSFTYFICLLCVSFAGDNGANRTHAWIETSHDTFPENNHSLQLGHVDVYYGEKLIYRAPPAIRRCYRLGGKTEAECKKYRRHPNFRVEFATYDTLIANEKDPKRRAGLKKERRRFFYLNKPGVINLELGFSHKVIVKQGISVLFDLTEKPKYPFSVRDSSRFKKFRKLLKKLPDFEALMALDYIPSGYICKLDTTKLGKFPEFLTDSLLGKPIVMAWALYNTCRNMKNLVEADTTVSLEEIDERNGDRMLHSIIRQGSHIIPKNPGPPFNAPWTSGRPPNKYKVDLDTVGQHMEIFRADFDSMEANEQRQRIAINFVNKLQGMDHTIALPNSFHFEWDTGDADTQCHIYCLPVTGRYLTMGDMAGKAYKYQAVVGEKTDLFSCNSFMGMEVPVTFHEAYLLQFKAAMQAIRVIEGLLKP